MNSGGKREREGGKEGGKRQKKRKEERNEEWREGGKKRRGHCHGKPDKLNLIEQCWSNNVRIGQQLVM